MQKFKGREMRADWFGWAPRYCAWAFLGDVQHDQRQCSAPNNARACRHIPLLGPKPGNKGHMHTYSQHHRKQVPAGRAGPPRHAHPQDTRLQSVSKVLKVSGVVKPVGQALHSGWGSTPNVPPGE